MINADEFSLFEGMVRWGIKECERQGMDSNQPDRQRQCLGEALFLIRYLTFPPSDFAAGPAKSGLLTQTESFAILMNISSPGSWEMPEYMNKEIEPRKIPRELMPMLSSGNFFCFNFLNSQKKNSFFFNTFTRVFFHSSLNLTSFF